MVFTTKLLFQKSHRPLRKYLREGFRDSLRVYVRGGSGGNGLPKFGGVGGQGGSVIAVAKEDITLDNVYKSNKTKRYLAKHGRDSTHNFIIGVPGEDLKFEVPVGVTVITEMGKKLGELNEENEELVVAKGGTGGHPKNGFLGTKGQAYNVSLDLKLIADVGLVGFPNAGKSTLLRAISHAKPRVADYPFTTIRPNVGKIIYKDLRQISMADLPGLIEGAYANRGMGHSFLKHVERTKLLLLIVDINGFQLGPKYPYRSCLETVALLNKELELYNVDLLKKPAMLLVNKLDCEGAKEKYREIKSELKNLEELYSRYSDEMRPKVMIKFDDIIGISAKTEPGDVEIVKQRLRDLLDCYAELNEKAADDDTSEMYNRMTAAVAERGPKLI